MSTSQELARDIRHRVAELLAEHGSWKDYSGYNGAVDSALDTYLKDKIEQIQKAEREAAAMRVLAAGQQLMKQVEEKYPYPSEIERAFRGLFIGFSLVAKGEFVTKDTAITDNIFT